MCSFTVYFYIILLSENNFFFISFQLFLISFDNIFTEFSLLEAQKDNVDILNCQKISMYFAVTASHSLQYNFVEL